MKKNTTFFFRIDGVTPENTPLSYRDAGVDIDAGNTVVERIKPLQQKARQRIRQLKLRNVQMNHADGGMGWAERGPFDGILAAAAPESIPQELLQQLAPGGRLVIPVGGETQLLHVVDHTHEGFETTVVEAVYFVPLRPGTVR